FDPTNGGPPRADLGRNKDFGRCGPHLATDRFIIGTDFSIYYLTNDFDVKKDMFNAPCVYDCFFTRQDCQIGGLAANGFYYQYGNVCACLPYVHGVAGLTSVPSPDDKTLAARSGPDFVTARMDASTASNLKSEIPNPQSAPWPTYRHDAFRSAVTMAGITPAVTQQWCTPAGPHVSAPVIADGKVFVAIPDNHTVLALDASSGARLWSCYAGGRVDTPPTYHNGTVLFGAHDGWVYCADARDGALKWKRRIAPGDDQICVRGQLESPWPVVGAVLVDNSVAYASAGRHGDADGGVRFCALDPANGDVLWRLRIEGFPPYRTDPHRNYIEARDPFPIPYDEEAMKIAEPDLVAGMVRAFRNDLLISDDNTVYIGAMAVDKAQRAPVGAPVGEALYSGGPGLLYESTGESAWLNKPVRWLLAGKTSGPEWRSFRAKGISANLLAVGSEHAYGVLMDSRKIYLFRKERPKGPAGEEPLRNSVWSVPLSTNDIPAALVVAGDTVTVAVRNPDNASGNLLFFSSETGKQAGSCPLPGAPRFDGVAIADGRIYASLGDGRVTCLGTR
ncbi:PQQ-binding-like beta-propeller repeat protein, partial [bacterium]|nr:PQQ-binding-like beta-propeller repeat protein [bacterium]